MERKVMLGLTLAFIGLLTFLTIKEIATRGFSVLEALSLLVLALFGFGIVGALRHPPED
jgi:hypothetical protein